MTAIEKIDVVLWFLSRSVGNFTHAELHEQFKERGVNFSNTGYSDIDNSGAELLRILNKLVKDGYVDTHIATKSFSDNLVGTYEVSVYYITFEGNLLFESGGYDGEIKRKDAENIRLDNVEKRQRRHESNMVGLTLILAFAAVSAIPYYMFEMMKSKVEALSITVFSGFLIFGMGIASGLLIWLIVRELQSRKDRQ